MQNWVLSPWPSEASDVAPWNKLFPWLLWSRTLHFPLLLQVPLSLPGSFSLHNEAAHHFSPSHLLVIPLLFHSSLGVSPSTSMASKCRLPVLHQPRSLFQADPEPHQILFSGWSPGTPYETCFKMESSSSSATPPLAPNIPRQTSSLPLLIITGNGLPRSHPRHSLLLYLLYHQVLLILPSSSFLIRPICIPVTTKVQDTRVVFCLFVYFLFFVLYTQL